MIRAAAVLLLALSGPAAAQGPDFCAAVWQRLTDSAALVFPLQGKIEATEAGDCLATQVMLETPGDFVPDWHADSMLLRGTALAWLVGEQAAPDRLEVEVSGLHLVVETGNPQIDYTLAAQARANRIQARAALTWDATAKALVLETLEVDFPAANRLELAARIEGVDLSSTGAAQTSLGSFALTEVDLLIQSHGLFEWYLLNPMAVALLPHDGDMQAAEAGLKAEAAGNIARLPGATFSQQSKSALLALVSELPNPSGILTLSLRSEAGLGPVRLSGYAVTGVPATIEAAAPLLDGVSVDIGWTPEDAP